MAALVAYTYKEKLPSLNLRVKYVRNTSNLQNIPILAMSGYDKAYLATAMMAGANATLHKPEDLENLTTMVQSVIGSTTAPTIQ